MIGSVARSAIRLRGHQTTLLTNLPALLHFVAASTVKNTAAVAPLNNKSYSSFRHQNTGTMSSIIDQAKVNKSFSHRLKHMKYSIDQKLIYLKNTLAENFTGAGGLATHQFSIDEVPSQKGKVAVITGGSQGIGYGVSHTLLKAGIEKLFILSVSQDVVQKAKDAVAQEMGQEVADRTVWLHCDLTDWKEVKDVAEKIKKQTDRLDILVNNAGRGIMSFELTDYGVDRHMAYVSTTLKMHHPRIFTDI